MLGDERLTEHGLGALKDFFGAGADLHATLQAGLKGAFAASAGVDLRLHHHAGMAGGEEFLGDGAGGFGRGGRAASGHGDPVLSEQLLGLEFVDVHGKRKAAPGCPAGIG